MTSSEPLWRVVTIAPALAVLVGLTVAPLVMLLVMTVYDIQWVEGVSRWTYVGAKHLVDLPADALFRAGIGNTAVFAIAAVVGEMLLGFGLALLVGRAVRGRVVYRALFVLPILVPGIVIGAIWQLMYNADFGVINDIAVVLGLPPQDWLGDKRWALISVIMVDVWHWTPFCFLLLLAGLESLPQDVYEASRVDGAGALAQLRYVTLPLMAPTILVTLVFRLIVAVKVFDEVYLLTAGGPGTATEVISFTIYRRFFTEDRSGIASTMSVVTLLAVSLLVILALAAARRRGSQP
ncbi:MAG: sugar ABC transporter permease [Proteobacteria bacterium]|nr:sugar ABC transporter permease [Pseudomonadota bacterium]